MLDIRRRQFITLLGGAAAAWPLVARAQQSDRVRLIGVMGGGVANDPNAQANIAAFLQVLEKLGWTVGRNLRIESRQGAGNVDDTRKYAAEVVALAPDVILSNGTANLGPLLQATRTVPIVFTTVVDPVGGGFVNTLARPGGNATGFIQSGPDAVPVRKLSFDLPVAPGQPQCIVRPIRPGCVPVPAEG